MSFDDHARAVVKSCNYHTRAIRHVRHLLTESTAQTLACSLINSRLDYCNSLLHGAPDTTICKLQRAQNNAARAVLQADRSTNSTLLLHRLHWLPVCQRITFKIALIAFKARTTGLPDYLNCHLIPRVAVRSTRSADLPLLQQHRTKTEFAKRAFSNAAPKIWNSLPADVLNCNNLMTFKRTLKTYLFREHFNVAYNLVTAI